MNIVVKICFFEDGIKITGKSVDGSTNKIYIFG